MLASFNHIVGKSTISYGISIPKSIQPLISLPSCGEKRQLTVIFDEKRSSPALLRRLNNTAGHVQIRYDIPTAETLRNWLGNTFQIPIEKNIDEINWQLVVNFMSDNTIELVPVTANHARQLKLGDLLLNNIKYPAIKSIEEFVEMTGAIRGTPFSTQARQTEYNAAIKKQLVSRGWEKEQPIVPDRKVALKCDFRKNGIQLEIEFGNARTYYQDIVKFAMSYNAGSCRVGGLIVPDYKFSKHLCELGSKEAIRKSSGSKRQYSGMVYFEKAADEFEYLRPIFKVPFFIAGIGEYKPTTKTAKLRLSVIHLYPTSD